MVVKVSRNETFGQIYVCNVDKRREIRIPRQKAIDYLREANLTSLPVEVKGHLGISVWRLAESVGEGL